MQNVLYGRSKSSITTPNQTYNNINKPIELSDSQLDMLADELDAVYKRTQSKMGKEDLDYISHVREYSLAIKDKSDELFQSRHKDIKTTNDIKDFITAYKKGIVLRGLHKLLEFSIGHVILHGAFDHLYDNESGKFHSSEYQWHFAVDTEAWKTMHHQNHHPYTNIKGLDHDLGYGLLRVSGSQNWWGHHLIQYLAVASIMASHSAYFSLYTAYSAGAIEKKHWYKPSSYISTYKRALAVLTHEWYDNYISEPLKLAKQNHTFPRKIQNPLKRTAQLTTHALGNLLGNMFGYNYLILLLLLEHHSHNTAIYEQLDRTETKGEYYLRQIMATTNFIPHTELDPYLQQVLTEVDFASPPNFRVFYEALDTHLEHHLFPDLPGNRLRGIVPEVQNILARYGLPYHVIALEKTVPNIFKRLGSHTMPLANENETFSSLLKTPHKLAQRLFFGLTYRQPPTPFYLGTLREDLTPVRVLKSCIEADGMARSFVLELPESWQQMTWAAGSFISVQISIKDKDYIRQYSLTNANQPKYNVHTRTLNITVKRVQNGKVSNYLNDNIKAGDILTLFRKPQGEKGFVMDMATYQSNDSLHSDASNLEVSHSINKKLLFIAGGVGITPLISMMRALSASECDIDIQLLYFNRNPEKVIFKEELIEMSCLMGVNVSFYYSQPNSYSQPSIHSQPNCYSQTNKLEKNLIPTRISKELLSTKVTDLLERDIYICAPIGFINQTKGYLTELGYDMTKFHMEMFQPESVACELDANYRYHDITFAKSGKTVRINENTSLLVATQKAGIAVLTGCEKGICKACVCPKLSGKTSLEDEHTALEKVTICNARPKSDIVLNI